MFMNWRTIMNVYKFWYSSWWFVKRRKLGFTPTFCSLWLFTAKKVFPTKKLLGAESRDLSFKWLTDQYELRQFTNQPPSSYGSMVQIVVQHRLNHKNAACAHPSWRGPEQFHWGHSQCCSESRGQRGREAQAAGGNGCPGVWRQRLVWITFRRDSMSREGF